MVKIWVMALLFLMVPFVSAEILISQPATSYSVSDQLESEIILKPFAASNDFASVSIECGEESFEIYKNHFSLTAGQEQSIKISNLLSASIVRNLEGECALTANYGGETASSQTFLLSKKIEVDFQMQKLKYDPGETINISGEAFKSTQDSVEGFVEASMPAFGIFASSSVSGGKFNLQLAIPSHAAAGKYPLVVRVYDKDYSGQIGNEGNSTYEVEVKQVLSSIDVVIDSVEARSGDNVTYFIIAYDQSGVKMNAEITATIYVPGDFVYSKKIVNSGFSGDFQVLPDTTPGFWKVEAISGDIIGKELFHIEENMDASFSLIGNTLIVTNIGNVDYFRNVEVGIGSVKEIKQISLIKGETKKYQLNAPEGDYLIKVNDGEKETNLGTTFLTGKVIGVDEIVDSSIDIIVSPAYWIIGIMILVLASGYLYLMNRKGFVVGRKTAARTDSLQKTSMTMTSAVNPPRQTGPILTGIPMAGRKEEVAIVAVEIKNELKKYASEYLDSSLSSVSEYGGKIYVNGDFRVIVFSNVNNRSMNVYENALKASKKIQEAIEDYNKRFRERINVGIGVNNGEAITEFTGGQIKFTFLGSTLINAKRAASNSTGAVFVSDQFYRRNAGGAKYEKFADGQFWRLSGLPERQDMKKYFEGRI